MTIDKDGIKLDSFETIFNDLVEKFKSIYGDDINLDQNSPDGQVIGIFTNVVYDMQSFLARLYNSFDPDFAEGHELDKILKLIATTRLPATKSIVDVEITVNANVVLPEDYTLKDINNQKWIIKNGSQTLVKGVNIVTFEAENWGAIEAQANTITEQVTIIPEVVSVTNPKPAIVGRDEETDVELRKRRNKILSYNAKSLVGSLLAKLLNITDVKDAIIYENNTDTFDTVKNIPPHSIWIIVDGGDVNEIAKVIATDKTIGTGLKGEIKATYIETFTRLDGTTRKHIHEVKFDRPKYTNIYIKFNVKKKTSIDIIDIQAIKNALVALDFNINQSITVTELYSAIYTTGNNFIASNLELSKDGENWVNDLLNADYDEKFIITDENITIEEIVQ